MNLKATFMKMYPMCFREPTVLKCSHIQEYLVQDGGHGHTNLGLISHPVSVHKVL